MGVKLVKKFKEFVTEINVEPAMLFFFVGMGMFYMPSQVHFSQVLVILYICINTKELYLEKTCKVNLNHSSGICDNLANHTTIKIEVQKEVAGIQVIQVDCRDKVLQHGSMLEDTMSMFSLNKPHSHRCSLYLGL